MEDIRVGAEFGSDPCEPRVERARTTPGHGAGGRGRRSWQIAEVAESIEETPQVRSLVLNAPDWLSHRAGQHVDVRLTAEDGYQAVGSYSIASATARCRRASSTNCTPVTSSSCGDAPAGCPLLLVVGGGSGIVPLMAILRERAASGSAAAVRLLVSWRTAADIIYADELERLGALDGIEITQTLTRETPAGWMGPLGRVDGAMLGERA